VPNSVSSIGLPPPEAPQRGRARGERRRAAVTVLFDGVCNLCNGSVRFIIANDPAGRFRFAALQSKAGEAALRAAGREPCGLSSIVVIDADGVHDRSEAALRIAAGLRGPWRALTLLRVIPARARDPVYDWIARNRYRWFGRRDSCALPTPEGRERFV
jgi:predicted DCC family thiol-disulfide oxidoreductase YuxK